MGAITPTMQEAAYSWTYSQRQVIWKGSGSISTGNNNPYRAELYAILISLLILKSAEAEHPITEGQATLISDSQKALKQALEQGPTGVKSATQVEYDIILEILRLQAQLQTHITSHWVKSHASYQDVSVAEQLNADAHQLAINRLKNKSTDLPTIDIIEPLANNIITVTYKKKPITSSLPQQILTNLHYEPLKQKIQKDKNWSDTVFQTIDWQVYHKAIITLPRSHRVSITKLSHGLWNTNDQNKRFYNEADTCPTCKTESETISHIFRCLDTAAAQHRDSMEQKYKKSLISAGTLEPILDIMLQGINLSVPRTCLTTMQSALRQAIVDQNQIGWLSFLQGYISTEWQRAYKANLPKKTKNKEQLSQTWAKNIILATWTYSKQIWEYRNTVVHGEISGQEESKAVQKMKQQAKAYYKLHEQDKYCVPYTRTYLFDKPLLLIQQLPEDNLRCWLNSVEEAIKTHASREALHHELSRNALYKFFNRTPPNPINRETSQVQKTSHIPNPHKLPLKPSSPVAAIRHLTQNKKYTKKTITKRTIHTKPSPVAPSTQPSRISTNQTQQSTTTDATADKRAISNIPHSILEDTSTSADSADTATCVEKQTTANRYDNHKERVTHGNTKNYPHPAKYQPTCASNAQKISIEGTRERNQWGNQRKQPTCNQ
jgi:hypothetical protein